MFTSENEGAKDHLDIYEDKKYDSLEVRMWHSFCRVQLCCVGARLFSNKTPKLKEKHVYSDWQIFHCELENVKQFEGLNDFVSTLHLKRGKWRGEEEDEDDVVGELKVNEGITGSCNDKTYVKEIMQMWNYIFLLKEKIIEEKLLK